MFSFAFINSCFFYLCRDDLVYLPPPGPTTATSRIHGPSSMTPPPRPVEISRPPTLHHTNSPARRSLLRTQNRPSVTQTAATRLVTPPPTSASRHLSVVHVTTSPPNLGTGLPQSPSRGRLTVDQVHTSNEQQPCPSQPSPSSTSQPRNRVMTPIYPWLVRTDMTGYFKIEDGVSYRSSKGKSHPLIYLLYH